MSKANYCVFIGRFQPLHNGHLEIIKNALEEANQLILLVGSYRSPRLLDNPWNYEERIQMIKNSLDDKYGDKIIYDHIRDYKYCNMTWLTSVQNTVTQIAGRDATVKLIGHQKDDTSFYLEMFPQWKPEIELMQQLIKIISSSCPRTKHE